MRERETSACIEPEATTHAVGLTPGYILEQCITELEIHFQCEYSRAICPCWIGDSSSRLLRSYGTVTSALSVPILLSTSSNTFTDDDLAGYGLTPSARERVPDPLLQGHFLRTSNGHDSIPFPVLFVAPCDEIYDLLASAVLYRRTMGVHTPCLAFLHNPFDCQLRAVWAWCTSDDKTHLCPTVHVAHAPWQNTLSQELGVFDMQDTESAAALGRYLWTISPDLYKDILTVQKSANETHLMLWDNPQTYWRVDQNAYFHSRPSHTESIDQWLRDVQSSSHTLSSSPSIWPTQEPEDLTVETPPEPHNKNLAQASSALEDWKLSHPNIVFADFSQWSQSGINENTAPSPAALMPEVAISTGLRVQKWAFPVVEFPEAEQTPEPLKMALKYLRGFLPPGGNLPSLGNQVDLPTLPHEIVRDDEGDMKIPCTLKTRENIQAFLVFSVAAQVEHWVRGCLGLVTVLPLDPVMTTYLMENISTFKKVCELCNQANTMPGGNEALYGECYGLLVGAHGDDTGVYKSHTEAFVDWIHRCVDALHRCSSQHEVFTARQRYYDEQHVLAGEGLLQSPRWLQNRYPSFAKIRDIMQYLRSCVAFDKLAPRLRGPAQECFTTLNERLHESVSSALCSGNERIRNYAQFKEYWRLSDSHFDNDKGLSAAVLQMIAFDTTVCDTVLYAPVPIDMNVDDLNSVSLFRTASQPDSSASTLSPKRRRLGKMFRGPIDAITDQILPSTTIDMHSGAPAQLGISEGSPSREDKQHHDKLLALLLPLVFLECKEGGPDPEKGATKTYLHLVMACRFMISLGMYDFPVFGLLASRERVRLFCAWAEAPPLEFRTSQRYLDKVQSGIFVADAHCPEWDISKPKDVIRLGLFLQHLRTTHRDRLEKKFEEVKKEVSDSWKHKDSWTPRERALREWKMSQQKETTQYKEWLKEAKEAWPEFSELEAWVQQSKPVISLQARRAARAGYYPGADDSDDDDDDDAEVDDEDYNEDEDNEDEDSEDEDSEDEDDEDEDSEDEDSEDEDDEDEDEDEEEDEDEDEDEDEGDEDSDDEDMMLSDSTV
ncbi:hypothetical protein CYLTODRAFT_113419 [Cylindrobasidium torrendii FP15055 ss-10]|uniref:Uncharacterized protein n=1 Tax=Cylindrobasidium torrendii FP15055 ss-10 TaxID=1314674 RepID=A0A0D7B0V2_9AGAR|nr:hypothetical protein CYLTODRAFT_113419 [Cylindrobasidium torrendii FP15055 ss-10]